MEVAGVVAAGVTFGALILKLSRSLCKSAKKIRYARRELMKLVKEMGIFADLYEDFYRVCVSGQRNKGRNTSSTRRLIDWIQDATDAFKVLLNNVRALAGDSKYSMRETLTAHVKWFFSENEVEYLRSSLKVAQESMRGFSNITIIEKINEEIQVIRAVLNQGDRQAVQALELEIGATLEERLAELKQTSRNRRTQRHAINSRMEEAAEVLQQLSMKLSASAIVPESEQLFAFTTTVEKYAERVQKQCRANTFFAAHSRQSAAEADSCQPINSTATGSFVSNPSPSSEPARTSSPMTSEEELGKTSDRCGKCTGICVCSEIESYPINFTRNASPNNAPPRRPAGFEHPSHRFDRSWHQPEKNETAYRSTKSTCPASDDDPCKAKQTLKDLIESDSAIKMTTKEVEKKPTVIEADGRQSLEPGSSQRPNHEEYESDDAEKVDELSDDEAQLSPFQPIAGVRGNFPRNWRNRHERRESPDDHWHKLM